MKLIQSLLPLFLIVLSSLGAKGEEPFIKIEYYEPVGTYKAEPHYRVATDTIYVKLLKEKTTSPVENEIEYEEINFSSIYIDDEKVAPSEHEMVPHGGWRRYKLNIAKYMNAALHHLQVYYSAFTISCYFSYSNKVVINGIEYELDTKAGAATVKEIKNDLQHAVIPATISYANQDFEVVKIDDMAFVDKRNLKSLVIPATVTSLANNAFNNCSSLEDITFEYSDKAIKLGEKKSKKPLFEDCPLVTVIIGRQIEYSGDVSPFMGQKNLKTLSFLSCVRSIGTNMFKGCESLQEVSLDLESGGISSIGNDAFYGCRTVEKVTMNGLNGLNLWCNIKFENEYSNPLCYGAILFRGYHELTEINLSKLDSNADSFEIKKYAFYGCSSLKEVIIDIPFTIEPMAFANCKNLEYVDLLWHSGTSQDSWIKTISKDAFMDDEKLINYTVNATQTTIRLTFSEFNLKYHDENGKILPVNVFLKLDGRKFGEEYEISKGKKIVFSNLKSGIPYRIFYSPDFPLTEISTSDVRGDIYVFDIYADGFMASPTWSVGDAEFETAYMKVKSISYDPVEKGEAYWFDGFINSNASEVTAYLYILFNTNARQSQTVNKTVKIPGVAWKNIKAVATSLSSVRLTTEVNLSDRCEAAGIEWRRNDAPDNVPSTQVSCPVINGMLMGSLRGLKDDVYYQYRPYVVDVTGKYIYGSWVGFYTGDVNVFFEPELRTFEPTVSGNKVTFSGYALAGTDEIISQGFQYRKIEPTRSGENWIKIPVNGISMKASVDNLSSDGVYEVRSYAETMTDIYYGNIEQFDMSGSSNGIFEILPDEEVDQISSIYPCDVYNLQGILVKRLLGEEDIYTLEKGLYIIGNKKVFINK